MLEGMARYEKDFKGWAKVAEEVEGRELKKDYMKLLRYHFYKKSSSVWDELDFEGDVPTSSHATIG